MSKNIEAISDEEIEAKIKRLEMSLENKNFAFEALSRLFEKLGTTLELEKIIRLFSMTLVGQLSLSQISFYINWRETKTLEIYYSLGMGRESVLESVKIENKFIQWVLGQQSPVRIDRYRVKPDAIDSDDVGIRDLLLKSNYCYACPLMDGDDLLAMIMFSQKVTGEGFTDFNIEILHMIVSVAAMTIKNAAMYQETLQSKMELVKFSKLKKEFMHHTSHELRTPLTVLKSVLFSMEPVDGRDTMLAEMAREAVDKLQDVVDQVLSLNDVELDDSFFCFQETNVAMFLENYFRDVVPRLGEEGITVKIDKFEDPGNMQVDSAKIKIVLDKIIDNAVSSIEPGGTILLSTSLDGNAPGDADGTEIKAKDILDGWVDYFRNADETMSAVESIERKNARMEPGPDYEGYFVIRIKDDGVGIPSNEIELLAEPFTRASNSKLSDVKGLGLGLSISQKIIAGHGGHLFCRSYRGEGAEFSIWLPVVKRSAPADE